MPRVELQVARTQAASNPLLELPFSDISDEPHTGKGHLFESSHASERGKHVEEVEIDSFAEQGEKLVEPKQQASKRLRQHPILCGNTSERPCNASAAMWARIKNWDSRCVRVCLNSVSVRSCQVPRVRPVDRLRI